MPSFRGSFACATLGFSRLATPFTRPLSRGTRLVRLRGFRVDACWHLGRLSVVARCAHEKCQTWRQRCGLTFGRLPRGMRSGCESLSKAILLLTRNPILPLLWTDWFSPEPERTGPPSPHDSRNGDALRFECARSCLLRKDDGKLPRY